jgi:hypothetical protein
MVETTMAFINVIGEAIIVETNREVETVNLKFFRKPLVKKINRIKHLLMYLDFLVLNI